MRIINNKRNGFWRVGLLGLFLSTSINAEPVWTFSAPSPAQVTVASGSTATVQYTVTNQSPREKNLILVAPSGLTASPCHLAGEGSTCFLTVTVYGSQIPNEGIHTGPLLCEQGNPNQCYPPTAPNNLNISRGPVAGATISVNPTTLLFAENLTGDVTVTNNISSLAIANNVVATIPVGSNISVQNTTCGASLAVGASCVITFASSTPEGPTLIPIAGDNTNTVNESITVNIRPQISVNPTTLLFAENSTADVTVTNNISSLDIANNVVATIPAGSNISVQNTTCGASLAVGSSCVITFASSTLEGPTLIPIAGDNTNTVNESITVSIRPQISIANPTPSNRVVPVLGSAGPLALQITNDIGSVVNANNITVSNKGSCPNLTVDAIDCVSVDPGSSCSLLLSSDTPYIPCTIAVSGSNTANIPTTLIAFFHLGGLVFETSGGTGKVVIDVAEQFASPWTATNTDTIPNSGSLDNGEANTAAIIIAPSCLNATGSCAAYRCNNINPPDGWYLPALDEWTQIKTTLCPTGCIFGNFSANNFYWSSSQTSFLAARLFSMQLGPAVGSKLGDNLVRCVRHF